MSKITQLRIENFKRIGLVEIEPHTSTVVVAGRNAQGKSSALDAIACALGGTKLAPQRPIKDGADAAKIVVTTDDGMVVTRAWTASGSTLKIANAEGFSVPRPQEWLDKRIGSLAFDPLAFMRDKPADQAQKLRDMAGVDTRAIDAEHAKTFDERTGVNRDGKALAARFDAMPVHIGAEAIDVSAVFTEIEAARALDATREDYSRQAIRFDASSAAATTAANAQAKAVEAQERIIAEATARIATLRLDVARFTKDAETARLDAAAVRAKAEAVNVPDVAPLRAKIASAEESNRKVRDNADRARVGAELAASREKTAALAVKLRELEASKAALLASAKMPVDGLSFGADGVTFNGIPLSQASSAEQLRVSTAMGLAANPDMRVILIREGALLDDDGLRIVSEMAEAADAQVWIEVVGAGPAGSIVIEDGSVAP